MSIDESRRLVPHPHPAGDLQHILAAHPVRAGEGFLRVRVEHHLDDTVAVAERFTQTTPFKEVTQSGIALGCGNCYLTNFTVANNFLDGFTPSFNITNLSNSTSGWAFFYLGITYTTLGAWDVGAYEFAAPGSDALPPAKPKGVKLP